MKERHAKAAGLLRGTIQGAHEDRDRRISLAYLAGVLHGDGYCTAKGFGLTVKDRDFADAFAIALKHVSGDGAVSPSGKYWRVFRSNRHGAFSGIKAFAPANEGERLIWLRGLFDSEGNAQLIHRPSVSPNAYQRRIAIYSTDLATLERASTMLDQSHIYHVINATKNSASHRGSKVVFELRLSSRESYEMFNSLVGSFIRRKRETMERIVDSYSDPQTYRSVGGQRGTATRVARAMQGEAY